MDFKLIWEGGFSRKKLKMFNEVQEHIDSQCIAKMTPYVPVGLPRFRNSGKLRDSVRIEIPGKIVYTAPFAKHDYYSNVNHKHGGNPRAQRLWFEVMKSKHQTEILRGASAIVKGKFK